MAQYGVRITRVITGGPYAYLVMKDGAGFKEAVGLTTIALAIDAVKADIGADLGGTVVQSMSMSVNAS